jgi:alpha/beta superfamily hydrolase
MISGFLYRPSAKFTGKRPVTIGLHGGPQSQTRPSFAGRVNYYLNELGVAAIYPNVRGSSGYGKTFLKLDDGLLREDAHKDIGALLDWIKMQPGLDSDRVMVFGESYGGYLTLAVAVTIEFSDRAVSLSKQINLPQTGYLTLTEKGKALRALKSPDLAQKSFLEAVATIEQLRSQVSGGEHDYQRFFQNRISPYYEMIDLFIDRNNPAQALVYAERAKARVVLDVLRNGRVNINKLMSREEQLEERRLYSDLISLNAKVNAERVRQVPDEAHAKEFEINRQKARNAYEEFQV